MIFIEEKDFIDKGTPVNIVGVHPLSWNNHLFDSDAVPKYGLRPIDESETDEILSLARANPEMTWEQITQIVFALSGR